MDVHVIFQGETARTETATYIRGGRSYTTEQATGRSNLDIIVRQGYLLVTNRDKKRIERIALGGR